jgi:uncharacterized membrane protein YphA (DoxX/SURF4 family)
MRSFAWSSRGRRVRRSQPAEWAGLATRLVAAGVWLAVGITKIADLEQFRSQVHAYALLPGALEAPFAYALPFVEVVLGLYLVVGLLIRPAALVGCFLMIVFVAAMAQAWARGLSLDCGCFGGVALHQVGLWTILRDAALGLPSLALAIRPARFASLDRRLGLLRSDRDRQVRDERSTLAGG